MSTACKGPAPSFAAPSLFLQRGLLLTTAQTRTESTCTKRILYALPSRSSCAQARTRATDADLRRSGELVDEPGSGAGPRRAYPSLHHGGPASMCLSIWCPGPSHHSLASWGADSACCWLPLRGCVLGRVGGHENKSLIPRLLTRRPVQHGGVRLRSMVKKCPIGRDRCV